MAGAFNIKIAKAGCKDVDEIEILHTHIELHIGITKTQHAFSSMFATNQRRETKSTLQCAALIGLCVSVEVSGSKVEIGVSDIQPKFPTPRFHVHVTGG